MRKPYPESPITKYLGGIISDPSFSFRQSEEFRSIRLSRILPCQPMWIYLQKRLVREYYEETWLDVKAPHAAKQTIGIDNILAFYGGKAF
ncbi:hypothetical protein PsorP6_003265 [Peronosclerospora sorghi]|uniref:Uncharacterized protein n=1 Tax=Peronosclerospora sorghi TaxID=230839 RepID=A0ACC0VM25_9STRA|nr:hypothetical protein PsorP6_003265 [Peronosclerospora sorghi]